MRVERSSSGRTGSGRGDMRRPPRGRPSLPTTEADWGERGKCTMSGAEVREGFERDGVMHSSPLAFAPWRAAVPG